MINAHCSASDKYLKMCVKSLGADQMYLTRIDKHPTCEIPVESVTLDTEKKWAYKKNF